MRLPRRFAPRNDKLKKPTNQNLNDKLGFKHIRFAKCGEPSHPFAGAKWDMGPTSAGASLVDNKTT